MAAILLVEDVDVLRIVICKFLESAGHVVTECAGGDEASRVASVKAFDVIITDLWMREGDGVQFIRTHSADRSSPSIIAMTGGDPGATRSKSVELALQAGATRVLSKPVTKSEILAAVETVLMEKA